MDNNGRRARSVSGRQAQNYQAHPSSALYPERPYPPTSYSESPYVSTSSAHPSQHHGGVQHEVPHGIPEGQHLHYQAYPTTLYQPHNQAQYTSLQSYTTQQTAAAAVLSSQFSPPVVPQFYSSAVHPGADGSSAPTQLPHASAYPSSSYHYSAETASLPQPYTYQQPPAAPAAQLPAHPTDATGDAETSSNSLEQAYDDYLQALQRTFQHMRDGRLAEAGETLLSISEWLLTNAEDLGLVKDEQELYDQRMKMWREFNTAWLTVLGRQKELLQGLHSGIPLVPPMTLIRADDLEKMADAVVRWCNDLEKHGLVDYEMGVWEEEIIQALEDCLDLLEKDQGGRS